MSLRIAALLAVLMLAACQRPEPPLPPDDPNPRPNAAGLVPLPCRATSALRPVHEGYCRRQRHFVRPEVRVALMRAAERFSRTHGGRAVLYMEASWPSGVRPMPPHVSHGDGRQIDIVLFYADRAGRPLERPPTPSGYGAFEPPRREADRLCVGVAGHHAIPDPPANRSWRLDDAASRDFLALLLQEPLVRRVFIEPHLRGRLGVARDRESVSPVAV